MPAALGFGSLRFSPRPKQSRFVRKYTWEAALEYLVNGQSQLETRTQSGRFNVEQGFTGVRIDAVDHDAIDVGRERHFQWQIKICPRARNEKKTRRPRLLK